jgi:chromosomal replication initiation ATPase DnaA
MITEFSKAIGIPELSILGNSHSQRISDVRQVYWYLLSLNGFSCQEIARLNERDHSTISVGIKRVKGLLEANDEKITGIYNLTKNRRKYENEI